MSLVYHFDGRYEAAEVKMDGSRLFFGNHAIVYVSVLCCLWIYSFVRSKYFEQINRKSVTSSVSAWILSYKTASINDLSFILDGTIDNRWMFSGHGKMVGVFFILKFFMYIYGAVGRMWSLQTFKVFNFHEFLALEENLKISRKWFLKTLLLRLQIFFDRVLVD